MVYVEDDDIFTGWGLMGGWVDGWTGVDVEVLITNVDTAQA
jgi:hypothetical protein